MDYRNECAKNLLAKLARHGIAARAGYFGGATYCVGVAILSASEAVSLGAKIGEGHGVIGWDRWGDGFIIAFRDALVTA